MRVRAGGLAESGSLRVRQAAFGYGQMRPRGIQPRTVCAARFVQRQDGGSGTFGARAGRETPIRSASAST